jgi:hypothetical protein
MNMKLNHAEKLVENLSDFMKAVERVRDTVDTTELELLDGLYRILRDMRWEAIDYWSALKGDVIVLNPIWIAELKEAVPLLDAIFKYGSQDTLFIFFPHYITIHSGVKALEW